MLLKILKYLFLPLLLLALLIGGAYLLFPAKALVNIARRIDSENTLTINLQPFDGFPPELVRHLQIQLHSVCSTVILKDAVPFPRSAWFAPRARYKADTLIALLSSATLGKQVTIGLSGKDISTGKAGKDWGVMGLGYQPGKACVVSTFRLRKANINEQLYKVAIHELGHTLGLPHCTHPDCFMRDAEGHNYLDEETRFCDKCTKKLAFTGINPIAASVTK
ncbi:MAG: matrixin family metalloprotease [Taibaiella sp.]|nr:matrixin family metalloprotease [Taibaiella sp.]